MKASPTNDGTQDLVLYVVADNPIGEVFYYPDSNKWSVPIPQRSLMRSDAVDYYCAANPFTPLRETPGAPCFDSNVIVSKFAGQDVPVAL